MTIFLTVLHVVACLFLIAVVLLQRGKGAEMGAVFGGGAGATVFGSRGAGNFLTRMTTAAAVVFMLTSLTLAYVAEDRVGDSLFEGEESAPAAPESPFGEPAAPAPGAFEEVPAPGPEAAAPPAPEAAAPEAPAPEPEAPAAP